MNARQLAPLEAVRAEVATDRKRLEDAFITLGRMGGNNTGDRTQYGRKIRCAWLALRDVVNP